MEFILGTIVFIFAFTWVWYQIQEKVIKKT